MNLEIQKLRDDIFNKGCFGPKEYLDHTRVIFNAGFDQGYLASEKRVSALELKHKNMLLDIWTSLTQVDLTFDNWQCSEVKDASTKWAVQQALRYIGMKVNKEISTFKALSQNSEEK